MFHLSKFMRNWGRFFFSLEGCGFVVHEQITVVAPTSVIFPIFICNWWSCAHRNVHSSSSENSSHICCSASVADIPASVAPHSLREWQY